MHSTVLYRIDIKTREGSKKGGENTGNINKQMKEMNKIVQYTKENRSIKGNINRSNPGDGKQEKREPQA